MDRDKTREQFDSYGVYASEEFQAFCERFGIAWGLHTKSITITLPAEGIMTVVQEYHTTVKKDDPLSNAARTKVGKGAGPRPADDPVKVIDTTTAHNKEYRTAIPSARKDLD
jgi:hypothetical protein